MGEVSVREVDVTVDNERLETWILHVRMGIICVLYSGRRPHGKRIPPRRLPVEVQDWIELNRQSPRYKADGPVPLAKEVRMSTIKECATSPHTREMVKKLTIRKLNAWITVEIDVGHPTTERKLELYGEVGESGNGPTAYLPLDASEEKIEHERGSLQEYVNELEVETGWREPA